MHTKLVNVNRAAIPAAKAACIDSQAEIPEQITQNEPTLLQDIERENTSNQQQPNGFHQHLQNPHQNRSQSQMNQNKILTNQSNQVLITKTQLLCLANQAILQHGPQIGTLNPQSFQSGPNTGTSSKQSFQNGAKTGSSSQQSFQNGPNTATSSQQSFQNGPNTGTSIQQAFQNGQAGTLNQQSYHKGPQAGTSLQQSLEAQTRTLEEQSLQSPKGPQPSQHKGQPITAQSMQVVAQIETSNHVSGAGASPPAYRCPPALPNSSTNFDRSPQMEREVAILSHPGPAGLRRGVVAPDTPPPATLAWGPPDTGQQKERKGTYHALRDLLARKNARTQSGPVSPLNNAQPTTSKAVANTGPAPQHHTPGPAYATQNHQQIHSSAQVHGPPTPQIFPGTSQGGSSPSQMRGPLVAPKPNMPSPSQHRYVQNQSQGHPHNQGHLQSSSHPQSPNHPQSHSSQHTQSPLIQTLSQSPSSRRPPSNHHQMLNVQIQKPQQMQSSGNLPTADALCGWTREPAAARRSMSNPQLLDTDSPATPAQPREHDSDDGGFRSCARRPVNIASSANSSDVEKTGGVSSNVDSGRGSAAYSSGHTLPPRVADASAAPVSAGAMPKASSPLLDKTGSCESLGARLAALQLSRSPTPSASSPSSASLSPPLPPLSPHDAPRAHPHASHLAHSALPARHRNGEPESSSRPRDKRYRKYYGGGETTDATSETCGSLDLSSLLGAPTDTSVSAGDARAIRRQLRSLETMYGEVLQLLGVRRPVALGPRANRAPSLSSLPSSSLSERRHHLPRRNRHHDPHLKQVGKRFARLEAHVVTLARSVAHLSSEMRAHHVLAQQLDQLTHQVHALRHMCRMQAELNRGSGGTTQQGGFTDPERVKRLTKFFGDEPPLMRMFLRRLGYERYASALEREAVGAVELAYVGEERLRALGVPLGPRLRILHEAGLATSQQSATINPRAQNTTTTLAIV